MGGISVPRARPGCSRRAPTTTSSSQAGPWAITYTSAPLAHAETVAGPITATVYASSTTSETELVAELEDVTPSGASYPLTEGALLGSLRAVDEQPVVDGGRRDRAAVPPRTRRRPPSPSRPGAVTEYQIQIFPTLATIAAGNRLRLTLATADTPHLTPLPGQLPELAGGVYTIARSAAAPSSLTVELLK